MTFSLISLAVLLIAALVIVIEVVRAINRGRHKTLVTLASLFLALFVSIIVTGFLSKLLAKYMLSFIKSVIDISEFSNKITTTESILFAYADAFVAPLIFLFVFILVRILIAIVIKIVYTVRNNDIDDKRYESEDAPSYKKKPNFVNGLLGALCGFLVMVVCIAPILGSVKIATKTFKQLNEASETTNVKFKQNAIKLFENCSNDLVGNVFYYCGGNLVYRSVATSKLNDNYFGLKNEIDNTFITAENLLSMNQLLNNIDAATDEEKKMLKNLGRDVDKTETLKSATADVLPVIAKNWLNDEDYEGIKKPKVSKACESFFDKMLYVCKSTTPETVGDDLSTLLNVYLIAYEHGVLVSENYKEMIEKAKVSGAFDLIKKELNKNPRMAGISVDIDTMGMKSIASALQSFNFENYDILMNDITSVLNDAINRDNKERLDYVTEMTKQYIQQYGIDLGDDVAEEVAQRLVDELVDHRTSVTVEDLKEFWDKYSIKAKGENNANNSGTNNGTNNIVPPIEEPFPPIEFDPDYEPPFDEDIFDSTEDGSYEDDTVVDEENNGETFDETYYDVGFDDGFYY